MGALVRAVTWLPRRLLLWVSDNPLRAAGAVAAAMATALTVTSLEAEAGGLAADGATLAALAAFAAAHPAYPVAVAVGAWVFLRRG